MALQTTKPSLAHALVFLWDQSEAFSAAAIPAATVEFRRNRFLHRLRMMAVMF